MPSSHNGRSEDAGLVSRLGPIAVDWPRTAGYFGCPGVSRSASGSNEWLLPETHA